MSYQKDEKELCIMDYVWNVLLHWRRIVVFMVIFAFIIGGMKYVKDLRSLYAEAENTESSSLIAEDVEEKVNQIPKEDRVNTVTVINLIKELGKKNSYVAEASVMQLDAYNVDRIVLQYHIETDNYISELMNAYSDACFTSQAIDEIINASKNTITANDVEDMISFRNGGENLKIGNKNSTIITMDDKNSVLTITIRGKNQSIAESIAESIKNILEKYKIQAEKLYGFHSLVLVNESYENGKDDDIVSLQNSLYDSLYYMTDRINTIKKNSLGGEAIEIVNDYMAVVADKNSDNGNAESPSEVNDNVTEISISKKWLLVGAVLGVILGLGLEFLFWIGSGKLNSADELQQNFSMRILGVIEDKTRPKKVFNIIDDFIYKIKNRNRKLLSQEQTLRMILSGIVVTAKRAEVQEVYVTGTEIERNNLQSFLETIKQEIEKLGIKLVIGQCINSNAEAFLEMASIGNTILIEETNVSIYQEIVREVQICEEQEVNVLGSIVIEH